MSSLGEQIGTIVRHLRKDRGWTQAELAERVGLSVEMVNRVERGKVIPSLRTLEAMAQKFDVPVRDLFGVGTLSFDGKRNDALIRLVDRVSVLDPVDLLWVDDLVRVALSRRATR